MNIILKYLKKKGFNENHLLILLWSLPLLIGITIKDGRKIPIEKI